MNVAQDRHKSYADRGHRQDVFEACEKLSLKVSLTKGVLSFSKKGKLSPRFNLLVPMKSWRESEKLLID